jgi:peptidoglycan/LPS O-acetylase OafA/YrhL
VVVFFVLSGFVIGYVADMRDTTWQMYSANRAARLWSVVLPALLLTLIVDYVGVRVAPAIYDGPWFLADNLALRYLASALMLQEVWHQWLVPGINGPFWSLTYEAFYYIVFGILFYSRSRYRWALGAIALVVGGPLIAVLFPLWLLGYLAYRVSKGNSISTGSGYFLFAGGLVLLALAPHIRASMSFDVPVMEDPVVPRYVEAMAIFANIVGASALLKGGWTFPARARLLISYVAGTTFALYLFHRPLIQLFSFVGPADSSSPQRRILVIGGTIAFVLIVTPLTERLRKYMRQHFYAALVKINRVGVSVQS